MSTAQTHKHPTQLAKLGYEPDFTASLYQPLTTLTNVVESLALQSYVEAP